MANEIHLLLTFGGSYTAAPPSQETWANTLRLALVFGSIDPVGTLPNNWAPQANPINRTEANWRITGNWNVSLNGATFNPDDFLNDQVAPALTTWIGGNAQSSLVRLDWAKVFPIGTNGKAVPAPPYSQGTPCLLEWTSSNPTGGSGSSILPLQVAGVVSHESAQIGRRGRGRMFLPGMSTANLAAATGQFSNTIMTSMLAKQQALLTALTGSAPGTEAAHWQPIIVGKPWTSYAVINQVTVDSVPDTQRRRRRSLVGTKVTGTVPA